MAEIAFVFTLYILILVLIFSITSKDNQTFVIFVSSVAFFFFLILLNIVNSYIPFAGGGDDNYYYEVSNVRYTSFQDFFDVNRYLTTHAQPGYPWILGFVSNIFVHDLLLLKYLNLFLFLCTAIFWEKIGSEIESKKFGKQAFLLVLLLTPLWVYFLFLLKDMSLVFLQTAAILMIVRFWKTSSILYLLPFLILLLAISYIRLYLIVLLLLVALGSLILQTSKHQITGYKYYSVILFLGLFSAVVTLFSNADFISEYGITTQNRSLAVTSIIARSEAELSNSSVDPFLFPIFYFLIETTMFSDVAWSEVNGAWIRGTAALPWIFIIVPFIFMGLWTLLARPNYQISKDRMLPILSSPWIIIILFIFSSFMVSWIITDSTRYRIADISFLAVVALYGFKSNSINKNLVVLAIWNTFIITGFTALYLL